MTRRRSSETDIIKAYHQVGTDSMSPRERAALLGQILEIGAILPAVERVQHKEMYNECFSETQTETSTIYGRFRSATPKAVKALEEMAFEWIEKLPEEGTTHTLFNCVDLLAGDLGNIFLSLGTWYQIPNGLVYDAEDLIRRGARFRPFDLLAHFESAIREAISHPYSTVREARNLIESMIHGELEERSLSGKAAISELRNCVAGAEHYKNPGCPSGEIAWPGRLPVGWALEVWQEGRLMRS